jgi:hypothetical protein
MKEDCGLHLLICKVSQPPTLMITERKEERCGSPGAGFIGDSVEPLVGQSDSIFLPVILGSRSFVGKSIASFCHGKYSTYNKDYCSKNQAPSRKYKSPGR